MAFTYLKDKPAKCVSLLPVVLVLVCVCCYFRLDLGLGLVSSGLGRGLKNLVLFTSLTHARTV